ncbi:callose synthase 11 [Fagus crenata]
MYGQHKAKGDNRAEEILYLMKNNEALRVAYVDVVHLGREDVEYYSVLVKYDQQLHREVEIYRIQLPGPLKLGEGKPENQNHALIFTRGDAVQTIDMNQDNYFEEALKMRNLLEEFNNSYGIRKPTILGVRENIFTGSVSSLAWFMSAQETSFVTLGQRVLANPLKYGIVYQLRLINGIKSIAVYLLSWIYMVVAVGIYIIISYARDKYSAKEHIYYRLVQFLVIFLMVVVMVILLKFTPFEFLDFVTSLLAFIPTGWGIILIAQVLRPFLQSTVVWDTVVDLARVYDMLFGVIVMAPVALLSWLPGFQSMQTRILFNEAFSRGLQISRILAGKKSK